MLALALIGDVANALSSPGETERYGQFAIVGLSGEVGQAITIAEYLRNDAEQGAITSKEVKAAHRLKKAGRKGGKQRHAETNRIIQHFFRFYDRTYLPRFKNSDRTPKKMDAIKEFYRLHILKDSNVSVDWEDPVFVRFKRMIYKALSERDAGKVR